MDSVHGDGGHGGECQVGGGHDGGGGYGGYGGHGGGGHGGVDWH